MRDAVEWDGGWPSRVPGALLCVAVAVIHVIDQGGFPGDKEPAYIGAGYYILEFVAVVTAVLLVAGVARPGWLLAAGVAIGPLAGYVLSRGPGLPSYYDDKGNWGEPLGVLSLVVEGLLLLLVAFTVWRRIPVTASAGGRSAGSDEDA